MFFNPRVGYGTVASSVGKADLFTAAFTTITTETLPTGLPPSMSRALHVPETRIGLLVGAYALLVMVVTLPLVALTFDKEGLPHKEQLAATRAAAGGPRQRRDGAGGPEADHLRSADRRRPAPTRPDRAAARTFDRLWDAQDTFLAPAELGLDVRLD